MGEGLNQQHRAAGRQRRSRMPCRRHRIAQVMQGVEVVDSLLLGKKETTWTPSQPATPARSLNVA